MPRPSSVRTTEVLFMLAEVWGAIEVVSRMVGA
jgi:hypothetical protein